MVPDTQVGLALLGHVVVLRGKSDKDALIDAIRPHMPISDHFEYARPNFYIAREGSYGYTSDDNSDQEIVLRSCENASPSFNKRVKISLAEALCIIDGVNKLAEPPTDDEFAAAFDALLT